MTRAISRRRKPQCPEHKRNLIHKIAHKGPRAGQGFWGCPLYNVSPHYCTVTLEEAEYEEAVNAIGEEEATLARDTTWGELWD